MRCNVHNDAYTPKLTIAELQQLQYTSYVDPEIILKLAGLPENYFKNENWSNDIGRLKLIKKYIAFVSALWRSHYIDKDEENVSTYTQLIQHLSFAKKKLRFESKFCLFFKMTIRNENSFFEMLGDCEAFCFDLWFSSEGMITPWHKDTDWQFWLGSQITHGGGVSEVLLLYGCNGENMSIFKCMLGQGHGIFIPPGAIHEIHTTSLLAWKCGMNYACSTKHKLFSWLPIAPVRNIVFRSIHVS